MALQPLVVALARQADDRGPGTARELDGERADSPGGPRDDDGLALLGLDGVHRPPRGHADDVQAAGHLPWHLLRLAREVAGLDQDQLGLGGPLLGEPDNLVTGRESADPAARRPPRRPRRGRCPARTGTSTGTASTPPRCGWPPRSGDAGRLHPHQDLPVPWHRALHLVDPQHVDPAELVVPDCPWHDLSLRIAGSGGACNLSRLTAGRVKRRRLIPVRCRESRSPGAGRRPAASSASAAGRAGAPFRRS